MAYGPVIDTEACIGCGLCVDSCQMDVFAPAQNPGDPPVTKYPDECWYDGACVLACPVGQKAIRLVHPLHMRLVVRHVK